MPPRYMSFNDDDREPASGRIYMCADNCDGRETSLISLDWEIMEIQILSSSPDRGR